MKIKIFRDNDITRLTNEVNVFCIDKVVHDIKYEASPIPTNYRGGVVSNISIYDSVLVMYDEE